MRRIVWAAVAASMVLPLVGAQDAGLRIDGFAVNLPGRVGDDAVLVTNPSNRTVLLDAYTLGDGEGLLAWPRNAAIAPGSSILIALNATAWAEAGGGTPDYALDSDDPEHRLRVVSGRFLLSQDGDSIILNGLDSLADVVVYGDDTAAEGWSGPGVALHGDTFLRWYGRAAGNDTDSAADWNALKRQYVGQDPFALEEPARTGTVVAYLAPDASRASVRGLIRSADQEILLNVYELADDALVNDLVLAAARGVDVRVLLDSQPVGRTAEELRLHAGLMNGLAEAGVDVRQSRHDRIAFNHAKYAVIDGSTVMVQTENMVRSGVPSDPSSGNRGWGVLIDDRALASQLRQVFQRDSRTDAFFAQAWTPPSDLVSQPPPVRDIRRVDCDVRAPGTFLGAHEAQLVLAPDHTLGTDDPVLAAIERARDSVRVVQLNAPATWTLPNGAVVSNPYLQALVDAAQRGVNVRILLDGHFVDESAETVDNLDTVSWLTGLNLSKLQAQLWHEDRSGVLHAKGLVIDDRTVIVGSMNWNLNSPSRNREVSVIVRSTTVGGYFAQTFDEDWAHRPTVQCKATLPQAPSVGALLVAIVISAVAVLRAEARRRS